MAASGDVKQLLSKAISFRRDIESWDNDFECDTDAAFRSSVSSSLSSSEGPTSRHYHVPMSLRNSTPALLNKPSHSYRNGSKLSTTDYLNFFRETEDDEEYFQPAMTKTLSKLSLKDEKQGRKKKVLKDPSTNDTIKNTNFYSANTLTTIKKSSNATENKNTIKIPQDATSKSTINKWSENIEDEIDDADFETGASRKNNTLRARQRKISDTSMSIVKGSFFNPPPTFASAPIKTTDNKNVTGTITNLQRRRQSPKKQPDCSMISEEDFESGFGELDEINPGNLQKFKSPITQKDPQLWEDDNLESANDTATTSRHDSISSSLFSHSASTNTESEVDGEDFLDGLVIPDAPIDFQKALQHRQEEAEAQERRSVAFRNFSGGSHKYKYDTVGSNGSKTSLESEKNWDNEVEYADDEMDFFQDIDIGDGDLIHRANLHRNLKLKTPESNTQSTAKVSSKKSNATLSKTARVGFTEKFANSRQASSNSLSGDAARQDRLRSKKSMPLLQSQTTQLLDQDSGSRRLHHQYSVIGEETFIQQQNDKLNPQRRTHSKKVSSLRHIHSIAGIGGHDHEPTHYSLKKKSLKEPGSVSGTGIRFSRAHTGKVLGDGTELDLLDDLPVDPSHELSFTVQPISNSKTIGRHYNSALNTLNRISLTDYIEKPIKTSRKSRNQNNSKNSKDIHGTTSNINRQKKSSAESAKGPRLIKQLSVPISTTVKGYNENMHFNVKTYCWEGNNEDLDRFDNINGGHGNINNTTKTPGLIAFISSNEIKVVGDMVFDPSKMCWISIREGEEDDPFKDFADDDGDDNNDDENDDSNLESLSHDADITFKAPQLATSQLNLNKLNDFMKLNHKSHKRVNTDASLSTSHSQVFSPRSSFNGAAESETSRMSSNFYKNSNQSQGALGGQQLQQNYGEFTVGSEFELSDEMIQKFMVGQERWAHKVRGWFPGEKYDASYLQEIRKMVMKK